MQEKHFQACNLAREKKKKKKPRLTELEGSGEEICDDKLKIKL